MASVLRFAKHVQRFSIISSTRCISTCKGCKQIQRILVNKNEAKSKFIRCMSTQNVQQFPNADLDNYRLDSTLSKLDSNARKSGRIAKKDVEMLLAEIKNSGKATSNQCLLAIRCCGSLLPDEHLNTRTQLANEIWNTLEKIGCNLDVSHYNVLLKVHLENEHVFNPTEFLAKMESKGVVPNRVTFQRLVAYYCQQGDIDGAGKILEYMKQKDLPINENVFNALIIGHARANDMESARDILDVMRKAKSDPTSETYATLLRAYAEKGDIENIKKVFEETSKDDVFLLDTHYLELIYTLAKNGKSEHVDEVIKKLRRFAGFNQDAASVILRLIICGQDEVAYKLLCSLPQLTTTDGKVAPAGNFMIRQLVREERPVDKILKICEDLKSSGLNEVAIVKATEMALVHGKTDHAISFIKAMKKQNFPVRTHYFWPILANLKNSKANESRIYEVIDLMMEYGCPANYATFIDYAFPALNVSDFKSVVTRFKNMGHTVGAVASPLVEYFVSLNDLKSAADVVDEYFIRLNVNSLVKPLATAFKENQDVVSLLKILKRVKENAERNTEVKSDIFGNFLMDYARATGKSIEKVENLAENMLKNHFRISSEMKTFIENYLKLSPTDKLSELLSNLVSVTEEFASDDLDQSGISHPREMSTEDLESHLLELKSKNMSTRGVLRRLLMNYCRARNLERAEAIKEELDAQEFVYSAAMLAQLMDLYATNNKFEEAKNLFEKLKSSHVDFQLDEHKILNYASVLVKNDQFDEALKFVNEQQVNQTTMKNDSSAWRLLNAAVDKGNLELAEKLFDVIEKRKLSEPTNVILGPLVKGYIIKNDVPGAIAKFEECCVKYRCTPWRNQLFALLIKNDDADKLQKLMDLNSEIHGEMNTLYDLAFTFLECGRLREAKKVFESSGLRAKHARLDNMCERLIEEDRVKDLEELINMTRDLFDIDRDRMYFYLLKAYRKEKNYNKALGVWTTMQEENIFPSDKTLTFLADILKENNQPVPFSIPESSPKKNEIASSPIAKENIDEALNIKRRIESAGGNLKQNETAVLVERLIAAERLKEALNVVSETIESNKNFPVRILKFLMIRLASAGDVDSIKKLEEKLSVDAKRSTQFNNMLMQAYISSGRHVEALEMLEKDVVGPCTYAPGGAIFGLLSKHPYLLERVEKIATAYSKNNVFGLLNMIWAHYFCNEQYEKADAILKSNNHFDRNLTFRKVIEYAETTNNDAMVKQLCDVVSSKALPETAVARVYTSLLDIQCANNKFDEAFTNYNQAKDKNIHGLLNRSTLTKLKAGLQAMGKDVSSIDEKPSGGASSSSSTSSSSSSSGSDSDSDVDGKKVKQ